jgi:PPOX class probable F420-dependent enzyme
MPRVPVPAEIDAFLTQPNPATIATLQPDGSPNSVATWYLWEDGRVLVNMDESRARLDWMRRDPRVSVTALSEGDWYTHVSLRGLVTEIVADPDLADIDRLSEHYGRGPYRDRGRKSWSAWIQVDSWHGWGRFRSA